MAADDEKAHLVGVLDSMDVAVTSVDPEGRILFLNTAAARNLDRSREAAIGTSVFDYFSKEAAAAARVRLRQTLDARAPQRFDAEVTLPDGRRRAFESMYCPDVDARGAIRSVQIVARDVTPAAAEDDGDGDPWATVADELSLTRQRLKALLDTAPMIVSVYDLDMRIRYMNRTLASTSPEAVLGLSPLDWVVEEDRPILESAFSGVVATKATQDCEVVGKSGRTWLVRLTPLMHEGTVTQVLGCTIETTAQRRLQDEVTRKRTLESLGIMARGLAHDFNNLITTILNSAAMARARTGGAAGPAETLFEAIEAASHRAADLCEQMLLMAGTGQTSREPTDVNRAVREFAPLTRAASTEGVELRLELTPNLPLVRCGRVQLGQVVLNLLNNAADALGGRGEVRVMTDVFTVEGPLPNSFPAQPAPGTYVRLVTSDTGPGIGDGALDRIFDPFFSTRDTGHGLGLSIVLGILSSAEAAISVRSAPGEGTAMTVLWPLHETADQSVDHGSEAAKASRGTVLIVDDETLVRRTVSAVLSHIGYEVLEAHDGQAALALLSSRPGAVDVVLMDVSMPGKDGYQILEELRKREPTLPVLLSSGRPIELPGDDPFVASLPKPYRPDTLEEALTAIRRARRR